MSNTVFNARFTPTGSIQLTAETFQVTADIFDGTGVYSGFDLDLDQVVFLDTFNSISAPQSVSRYTIDSILSTGAVEVEVVLRYADTGSPVDPGEITGNPGFIAAATAEKLFAYHAAPTLHTIPDYIVQYARNYDNYVTLEDALGGDVDAGAIKGLFTNGSGSLINALTPVRQDSAGEMFPINPSNESEVSNILGLLSANTADDAQGTVVFEGLLLNVTTSFVVGDVIYLSKSGGLTATAPDIGVGSFVAGDFVVQIGKITKNATNGAQKDFKVEVQLRGQL
jgi:hypothetical protein